MNASDLEFPNEDPEALLAAYADGELNEVDAARVRAWLAENPAAVDSLAAQRAFSPTHAAFWSNVAPPTPSAGSWNRTLEKIKADAWSNKTATPTLSPRRRLGPWVWSLALVPAAAAAVVVAIAISGVRITPTTPRPFDSDEVFTVLEAHEVEIESVRPADMPWILIGDSPLKGDVTLMTYTDVKLHDVQPDWDGTMPQVHRGGAESAPMIYTPIARVP